MKTDFICQKSNIVRFCHDRNKNIFIAIGETLAQIQYGMFINKT